MTKSRNPNNQFESLKSALIVGSIAASILGTQMLFSQENQQEVATLPAPAAVPVKNTIDFQVPTQLDINLAPIPNLGDTQTLPTIITPGTMPQLDLPQALPTLLDPLPIPNLTVPDLTINGLKPIPTVVAPQPVTNSQSSG